MSAERLPSRPRSCPLPGRRRRGPTRGGRSTASSRSWRAGRSGVLLLAETGVGKEVTARALHEGAPPRGCSSRSTARATRGLPEAELFGFERGAFTGATAQKPGLPRRGRHGVPRRYQPVPLATQAKPCAYSNPRRGAPRSSSRVRSTSGSCRRRTAHRRMVRPAPSAAILLPARGRAPGAFVARADGRRRAPARRFADGAALAAKGAVAGFTRGPRVPRRYGWRGTRGCGTSSSARCCSRTAPRARHLPPHVRDGATSSVRRSDHRPPGAPPVPAPPSAKTLRAERGLRASAGSRRPRRRRQPDAPRRRGMGRRTLIPHGRWNLPRPKGRPWRGVRRAWSVPPSRWGMGLVTLAARRPFGFDAWSR